VIVPVLNEASLLPGLLDHLEALQGRFELIVVDGGSDDGSAARAEEHRAVSRLVRAPRGRARQMNAAAKAARGDAFLFLHADTRLPQGAYDELVRASGAGVVGGNFALRYDGGDLFSRLLGAWNALQRRGGVYYGDSAIWVTAEVFHRLGGYRELPVMEDYDLARRLERQGRTSCLAGPAVSSDRRWRRLGLLRTVASWIAIRLLFIAGVPPARLVRLYPQAR
jgi:rSAM/selenodomain-associated transferase 2